MSRTSEHSVGSDVLIELHRRTQRPHVVILGAGASVAAMPSGDANGNRLPVMNNLVKVLGLEKVIQGAGHDPTLGFESLYSKIHKNDPSSLVLKEIEARVEGYFGALVLPSQLTVYDHLLLSLREKDAIFTFNWDPFLADTYDRYEKAGIPLPSIFHLHGNVRVHVCVKCGESSRPAAACPQCGGPLHPSRLLYPIEKKDYASDGFIRSQWDAARAYIRDAVIITIFGYSAPTTDKEAMAVFTDAWKNVKHDRLFERVEVIDIRDKEELSRQWSPFSFYNHEDVYGSFHESRAAAYPRRSCEALYYPGVEGKFPEPPPWPRTVNALKANLNQLTVHE